MLLRWTKEVRVHDVEHREVGALLRRHLAAAGLDPGPVMVLNDTIAALAAGSLGSGTSPSRTVGLIVGTGSNMGAYLPLSRITKVRAPGWPSPFMAVNFESGAFSPPGLGAADDEVDERSVNPGAQRFEKAVSGAYLGRIFSAAAPRLGITGVPLPIESAEVSRLAVDAKGTPEGMLARALLDRSADLVAAALAATADMLDGEGALAVVAEGSLIQRGPGHAARVEQTLGAMLGTRPILIFRKDANLIGSALAALSHAASAT
ncbi:MAG: hypothetical protein U0359_10200 [Byssovorax sp.]